MKVPIRMMLLTGNKNQGFTFVEVMVALVVLSAGIVMIYKSFFLCVDYLSYLSCRLYASQMIESKISDISHSYKANQDNTFNRGAMTESLEINHKWIDFNYSIDMFPIKSLENVYRLKVTLGWYDGRRLLHLTRESILSKI